MRLSSFLRARARREFSESVDKIFDAKVLERAAPQDRGHMAFEEGLLVKGPQPLDRQVELFDRRGALVLRQKLGDARIVGAIDGEWLRVLADRRQAAAPDVISAGERASAADRPGERREFERERLLDLIEKIERIAGLAVHLVDEGDNRDVAQPADLEQFSRARLDALCCVDHHDGRVDGGQGPVGILGEVFVAGRIEQVENAIAVFERHH